MKTLLAMFRVQLNNYTPESWEQAQKDYDDISELFSLWKQDEGQNL
jgi:hypothetical protein